MTRNRSAIQGYRLSPQQRRLWAVQSRRGKVYWTACRLRLRGPLQPQRLRQALQETVLGHEILRTDYPLAEGLSLPVQAVREQAALRWRQGHWSNRGRAALEEQLGGPPPQAELGEGPHLSAALIRLDEEDWLLQLRLPSLSSDARSLVNLVEQAGRRYQGGDGKLPGEEALQYAQFAEWQNQLQEEEDEEGLEAREFWRGLDWEGLTWELPLGLAGPAVQAAAEARSGRALPEAMAQALRQTAGRLGASLEVFLLACWQTLLWRLTGRREFLLGWCCTGRHYEVLESALGLLARCLPLPCRFSGGLRFDEVLTAAAQAADEASSRQEYFDWEQCGDEPRCFTAGFQFLEWPDSEWAEGVRRQCLGWQSRQEPFGLLLSASDFQSSLQVGLEYDASRLSDEDAARLIDCLLALTSDAAAEPRTPVERLRLLDPAESRRLLAELNRTAQEEEPIGSIQEGFARQAAQTPDRMALLWGDAALSFASLESLSQGLAGNLGRLGVGPETVVGLVTERRGEAIAALLGILQAGGAYLPLDPTDPAERLACLLEEASAQAVVSGPAWRRLIPESRETVWFDPDPALKPHRRACPVEPANLAYLLYTSGSTGRPKGVMIHHRGAVNLIAALRRTVYQGCSAALHVSQNAPLSFDASVKQILQLLEGRTVCIVPDEVRLEGREFQRFLDQRQIDVLDVTPTQLQMLFESGWPAGSRSFPSLLLSGGEALTPAQWTRLASLEGRHAFNVYGPTECTVDAGACLVEPGSEEPSIGTPLANTRIFVLDPRRQPLPQGAAGELCVSGLGVARGYLKRPARTAQRFIPDPFSGIPGQRLYCTGDLAALLPDGRIRLLGRIDHQVKLRGLRIELGEIESALLRHPQVLQAAVVVRDDLAEGRGLAAYVRLQVRLEEAPGELRRFLRRRLPEYMVPSALMVLDQLPANRNGKVDRRALPAPTSQESLSQAPYAPPGNDTESLLAGIWQEVLQVEKVGVEDNFFDLGGHSLLMIQVHARLKGRFQRPLSIVDLFRHPRIRDLAKFLEGPQGESPAVEEARQRARRQAEALERRRQLARQRRAHG